MGPVAAFFPSRRRTYLQARKKLLAIMSIDAQRRRLSVGACEPVASSGGSLQAKDAAGKIKILKSKKVAEVVGAEATVPRGGGRRGSLVCSSETDKDLKRRQSYEEKDSVNECGLQVKEMKKTLTDIGLGYACKKGLKPESPNQDSYSIVVVEGKYAIYGVYDGHGPQGHDVSNFIKENLVKLIVDNPRFDGTKNGIAEAMKSAFAECQKLIEHLTSTKEVDASMSGATTTVMYHDLAANWFIVAHCGDSRSVLAIKGGAKNKAEDLTVDHKPNLPAEKKRIEANGGRVVFDGFYNHRVFAKGAMYPGLNMSRALGDVVAHKTAGLTQEPDIKTVDVKDSHDFVLLCTDGVWEFIESNEAVDMVTTFGRSKCQEAVEKLASESWDRWMKDSDGEVADDITAVVVYFGQK